MDIMSTIMDEGFAFVNFVNVFILRKLYHMDISPSARISHAAILDRRCPRNIHIGDDTLVTRGAAILAHDYCRMIIKKTSIGKECFIGVYAIILPGVSIGDHVIVGAGSVVTKDVKSNCIIAGNPATIIAENINTTKFGVLI
jgi:acetyltransferase-like isoleucine patch superfamily enzyme